MTYTVPTAGGWKVVIGNATYPIRYWDGTDTRFSVDAAGGIFASSITLLPTTAGPAVTIDSTGWASNKHVLKVLETGGAEALYIDATGRLALAGQYFDVFADLTHAWPEFRVRTDDGGAGLPGLQFGPGGASPPDAFLARSGTDKLAVAKTLEWGTFSGTAPGTLHSSGYIEQTEMTAPAAGGTNTGRLYLEDNGAGKTRLVVKFNTGAAQVIATQP